MGQNGSVNKSLIELLGVEGLGSGEQARIVIEADIVRGLYKENNKLDSGLFFNCLSFLYQTCSVRGISVENAGEKLRNYCTNGHFGNGVQHYSKSH